MKDRISSHPGRVLITPETGDPFYATLSMADGPVEEGTPLNKETFLPDDVASALGLEGDPLVKDALLSLNARAGGQYKGSNSSDAVLTFPFLPRIIIIMGEDNSTHLKRRKIVCFFIRTSETQGKYLQTIYNSYESPGEFEYFSLYNFSFTGNSLPIGNFSFINDPNVTYYYAAV